MGCETNDQCPVEASTCDNDTRSCRGCERDSECESGICLEADGICADEISTVFVASSGGIDTGDCTRAAPCDTLAFAFGKITDSRSILRLEGGGAFDLTSTLVFNRAAYVDGTDTIIALSGAGPAVRIGSALVTLTHVQITAGSGSAIEILSGGLRTFDVIAGRTTVTTASLNARSSSFESGLDCSDGILTISASTFSGREGGKALTTNNCQLTLSSTLFDDTDGSVGASGGLVIIENNVIVESDGATDSMFVMGTAPGSTVRFNTFVNMTPISSDGAALTCDDTVIVTNNIFAYSSVHPMHLAGLGFPVCQSTHSLFDTAAAAEDTAGVGNVVADGETFFVDRGAKDFHLALSSPAKEISDGAATVSDDFDGTTRPQPVGSVADVGAFEAP